MFEKDFTRDLRKTMTDQTIVLSSAKLHNLAKLKQGNSAYCCHVKREFGESTHCCPFTPIKIRKK